MSRVLLLLAALLCGAASAHAQFLFRPFTESYVVAPASQRTLTFDLSTAPPAGTFVVTVTCTANSANAAARSFSSSGPVTSSAAVLYTAPLDSSATADVCVVSSTLNGSPSAYTFRYMTSGTLPPTTGTTAAAAASSFTLTVATRGIGAITRLDTDLTLTGPNDVASLSPLHVSAAFAGSYQRTCVTPNGQYGYTHGADNKIYRTTLATGKTIMWYAGPIYRVSDIPTLACLDDQLYVLASQTGVNSGNSLIVRLLVSGVDGLTATPWTMLTMSGGSTPRAIAIDRGSLDAASGGKRLYWVDNQNGWKIMNVQLPATGSQVTPTINQGTTVQASAYSMTVRNKVAYVGYSGGGGASDIYIASDATATGTATTAVGSTPVYGLAWHPTRNEVYAATVAGTVLKIATPGHSTTVIPNPAALSTNRVPVSISFGASDDVVYIRQTQLTYAAGTPFGIQQNLYALSVSTAPTVTLIVQSLAGTTLTNNVPDYANVKFVLSPSAAPVNGAVSGLIQCSGTGDSVVKFAGDDSSWSITSAAPVEKIFQVEVDVPATTTCWLIFTGRDGNRYAQAPQSFSFSTPQPVRAPLDLRVAPDQVASPGALTRLQISPQVAPPSTQTLTVTCACTSCYANEGDQFLKFQSTGTPSVTFTISAAGTLSEAFSSAQPVGSTIECTSVLSSRRTFSLPDPLTITIADETTGWLKLNAPEYAPFPNKDAHFSVTPRNTGAGLAGLKLKIECEHGRTNAGAGQELRWSTAVPLTKSFVYRAPNSPLRGLDYCTFTSTNEAAVRSFTAYVTWGAQLNLAPVVINADLEVGDTAFYAPVLQGSDWVELAFQPEAAIAGDGVTVNVRCTRGHFLDGTGSEADGLLLEQGTVGLSNQRLVYVAPESAGMDKCWFRLTGDQALRFRTPKPLVLYVQSPDNKLPGSFSKAHFPQSIALGAVSEPIAIQPLDAEIDDFDTAQEVGLTIHCRYGRTSAVESTALYLSPARLTWPAGSHSKQYFRYEAPRVSPPGAQDQCWFELHGPGANTRFLPVHEGVESDQGVIQLLPVGGKQAAFNNDVKIRHGV